MGYDVLNVRGCSDPSHDSVVEEIGGDRCPPEGARFAREADRCSRNAHLVQKSPAARRGGADRTRRHHDVVQDRERYVRMTVSVPHRVAEMPNPKLGCY